MEEFKLEIEKILQLHSLHTHTYNSDEAFKDVMEAVKLLEPFHKSDFPVSFDRKPTQKETIEILLRVAHELDWAMFWNEKKRALKARLTLEAVEIALGKK